MSTDYYLVCMGHRQIQAAVSVSLLGRAGEVSQPEYLRSFIVSHRHCKLRVATDSSEVPENWEYWERRSIEVLSPVEADKPSVLEPLVSQHPGEDLHQAAARTITELRRQLQEAEAVVVALREGP